MFFDCGKWARRFSRENDVFRAEFLPPSIRVVHGPGQLKQVFRGQIFGFAHFLLQSVEEAAWSWFPASQAVLDPGAFATSFSWANFSFCTFSCSKRRGCRLGLRRPARRVRPGPPSFAQRFCKIPRFGSFALVLWRRSEECAFSGRKEDGGKKTIDETIFFSGICFSLF
jgi:hypothetical protein